MRRHSRVFVDDNFSVVKIRIFINISVVFGSLDCVVNQIAFFCGEFFGNAVNIDFIIPYIFPICKICCLFPNTLRESYSFCIRIFPTFLGSVPTHENVAVLFKFFVHIEICADLNFFDGFLSVVNKNDFCFFL